MSARTWRRAMIVALIGTAMTVGTSVPASAEPSRVDGEAATVAGDDGDVTVPAAVAAPPDLVIHHRLGTGGLNLWRLPLSGAGQGFGQPQVVRTLDYGGFSYDRSKSATGHVGDVTPSDDGTADHVIWHAQPNGGVLVWGVGGGGDPTPRLWHDLRTGGWSYAASTPTLADVNGDGWDDLVVRHLIAGTRTNNVWVFLSDGRRLQAPRLWTTDYSSVYLRQVWADFNLDGRDDRVYVQPVVSQDGYELAYSQLPTYFDGQGGGIEDTVFRGPASAGWSFDASRTLAGDVTGDGLADLVTIHAQAGGGLLAWMHENCFSYLSSSPCFERPVVWQDLRTGGWSFAGSRQYLADSDGDGRADLISVHQQSGNPGMLVWRHLSHWSGFEAPTVVADLRGGGWTYSAARIGVAD